MAEGYRVEEVPDNVVPLPQKPPLGSQAAITGILLGLKALSQASLVALSTIAGHVFALLTIGSAYWLWTSIKTPDTYQLIMLGMYALLVLAANVIVRKK